MHSDSRQELQRVLKKIIKLTLKPKSQQLAEARRGHSKLAKYAVFSFFLEYFTPTVTLVHM